MWNESLLDQSSKATGLGDVEIAAAVYQAANELQIQL